jgi:hypothetical protein
VPTQSRVSRSDSYALLTILGTPWEARMVGVWVYLGIKQARGVCGGS